MTRMTPFLRMILHLLQIFLTDDRTFILFVAEGYTSFCEIIEGYFHRNGVAFQDSDVINSHLARDCGMDDMVY